MCSILMRVDPIRGVYDGAISSALAKWTPASTNALLNIHISLDQLHQFAGGQLRLCRVGEWVLDRRRVARDMGSFRESPRSVTAPITRIVACQGVQLLFSKLRIGVVCCHGNWGPIPGQNSSKPVRAD